MPVPSDTLQAGALATRLISQEFEVGMLTSLIEKQAPDSPEFSFRQTEARNLH